jgi:arylsulfatase A-like enzyme
LPAPPVSLVARACRGLGRAVLLALAFSACARRGPAPTEVLARLSPLDAAPPAEARPTGRLKWTAEEIDRSWSRAREGRSVVLGSPPLDLAGDDLWSIRVTLEPGAPEARAILLWSDGPSLSRADAHRNRRDLVPARHESTVEVLAREIGERDLRGPAPEPLRHLFLHLPFEGPGRGVVRSVEVVTKGDRFSGGPPLRSRVLLSGEVRDAVFSDGEPMTFRADVGPSNEVLLGVRPLAGPEAVRVRVTSSVEGRPVILDERAVGTGVWTDYSLAVPSGAGRVLTLSVEAGGKPVPVYWTEPRLLGPAGGPDRPNVVLYVVDALRARQVGLYRNGKATVTPALDDLGRRGLVFDRAYVTATWTKPSIASLLTSLHPQTHALGAHTYSEPLPGSVATLPEILGRHGYLTALFSANAFAGTLSNLDKGFDWAYMPGAFHGADAGKGDGKVDARSLNERVFRWIDEHGHRRFFLYVHSVDPHPPILVPGLATPRDPVAAYEAAIAFNDAEIGRLHRRLADRGLARRTVFVVTADHGEAFGEHGQQGHGASVYDEEAHVPLLVHAPGMLRPGRVGRAVSLVDVAPTILELCSIPPERSMQGRSLVPRRDRKPEPGPVVVSRFVYPEDLDTAGPDRVEAHAVVEYPWKLIRRGESGDGGRLELYDLAADPLERRDLANAEGERARRLEAALDRFLAEQARARARYVADHSGSEGALDAEARAKSLLPADEVVRQLRSLGYLR